MLARIFSGALALLIVAWGFDPASASSPGASGEASGGAADADCAVDSLAATLLTSWLQPVSGPRALAFSREGNRLFVQQGGRFLLWQTEPAKLLMILSGSVEDPGESAAPLAGFASSFDGGLVAAGAADSVLIWDAQSGESVFRFAPEDFDHVPVRALTFTPEGRLLVGGGSGVVYVWDLELRRQLAHFSTYLMSWGALAANPLGAELAAGGEAEGRSPLALYSHLTGKRRRYLDGHFQGRVETIAYSPGGILLASGDDSSLEIWDLCVGERLHVVRSRGLSAGVLAFSPRGDVIVCPGAAGRLIATDPASGKTRAEWTAHPESAVLALAFAPDGRTLASAGDDGRIAVWRLSAFGQ